MINLNTYYILRYSYGEQEGDDDSLWTLVMTNPDGHFEEDEAEYLHWMVANISGQGGVADLATSGDTICPYLQPFPPYGTGFHRFVFVLYKQVSIKLEDFLSKVLSTAKYKTMVANFLGGLTPMWSP